MAEPRVVETKLEKYIPGEDLPFETITVYATGQAVITSRDGSERPYQPEVEDA